MAKSFKDKTTAPGVYASIIGSAQQEQQEQQAQQEHKAHPKNYRFNLNIPMKYKNYLQEIAWQNRTTITEYLVGLVAADAEKHPEILEKIDGKA